MTDVLLYQTNDGGDIEFLNGVATMESGLRGAAYLSLFGGNADDSGLDDDKRSWWGNVGVTDKSLTYRAETQRLLGVVPAIPANLVLIQEAAERDLAWMVDTGLAGLVSARVTMPGLNRVRIEVNILVQDEQFSFEFDSQWRVAG